MTSQIRRFAGLHLDANPHSEAPEGAMDTARNVEISSAGVVNGRKGYHRGTTDKSNVLALTNDIQRSVRVPSGDAEGNTLVFTDGEIVDWDQNLVHEIPDPAAQTTSEIIPHGISFQVQRKRLYVTSTEGVAVLAEDGSEFEGCGFVGQNVLVYGQTGGANAIITTGQTFLADGDSVAYRATVVRTVSEGFTVESAPSPRTTFTNAEGAPAAIELEIYVQITTFKNQLNLGDKVRLYRSFTTSSATPSDDMFLVTEIVITNLAADSVLYVDRVLDDDLRDPLYTNPSQEGAAAANVTPLLGKVLFEYQDSLFVCNIIGPWLRTVTWFQDTLANLNQSGNSTGLGARFIIGDFTNGSPTITNMANTTGLQEGMIINNANVVVGTLISSVDSGTQVTMTEDAINTEASDSITFLDSLGVTESGQSINVFPTFTEATFWQSVNGLDTAKVGSNAEPNTRKLAYFSRADKPIDTNINDGNVTGPGHATVTMAVLPSTGTTAPTIVATHGDEFDPPIPKFDETAEAMTRDVEPALVTFSKRFQPESFIAGGQQFFVGDADKEILGAVVASNVAYVFKEDGVFTITGAGAASGFRVDEFDTTFRLMTSRHLCEANGAAAAWTNRGIIMIMPGGVVQNITDQRLDAIFETAMPGVDYAGNMLFDELRDELVWTARDSTTSFGPHTFVFSTETGTWCERTLPQEDIHCVGVVPDDYVDTEDNIGFWSDQRRAWFRPDTVSEVWQKYADFGPQTITITDVTSNTVQFTHSSPFQQVSVGDILFDDPNIAIVSSVTTSNASGATVVVFPVTGTLTTGSAEMWYGIDSEIKLRQNGDADISAYKRWQTTHVTLDGPMRLHQATLKVDSSNVGAQQTIVKATPNYDIAGAQPSSVLRMYVGPNHAESTHLAASLAIREAGALWALTGFTLVAQPISRRVAL